MFLFINTAKEKQTQVALIDLQKNDKVKVRKKISSKGKSDNTLKLVDKILIAQKIIPQKLQGVFVVKGPGPFTAVRIALALSNTFSYVLQIPVFGIEFKENKKIEELVENEIKMIKNIKTKKIVLPRENI